MIIKKKKIKLKIIEEIINLIVVNVQNYFTKNYVKLYRERK